MQVVALLLVVAAAMGHSTINASVAVNATVNATGPNCDTFTDCTACTESQTWSGSTCRWCPKDNTCHAQGSIFNKCSEKTEITDPKLCNGNVPHTVLPADLEAQAKQRLYMAYAAYCKAPSLATWDCKWCKKMEGGPFKVYAVATNQSSQAFVVKFSEGIMISFRGSHNIENWIKDVTFLPISLPWTGAGLPSDAKVHRGFLESYMVLRDTIVSAVQQARKDCPTCTVHFTGHSLGAAQATVCATDFRMNFNISGPMWNYGCPRVGNTAFAGWYMKTVTHSEYRMVHDKDIVPHLPLEDMGFHHVGREVWEMKNKTYVMCDGSGEDPTCSDSIIGDSVSDHLSYMEVEEAC